MNRHDVAIRDADGNLAALVTVTPMGGDDAIAADARDLVAAEFDAEAIPVEVARDE